MKRLFLLGAAVSGALAAPAIAQTTSNTLPSGGQVDAGSATISTPAPGAMQIDQSSNRAIINWQSFSIGSAAWVRFNQPGASSVALNRVVGGSASEIFGRLTANGQVFLSNPNGVLFAPGASVEVGSLFATTLSITDQDFLTGQYRFSREGSPASVVNQGTIITPNGYTALAGPQVRNDGVIVARLGSVALAAGDRVSLDLIGDGLIRVSVDQAALNASVINTGTIQADGGRIILAARSANALLDTVINSSGVLRADALAERNGEIILEASAGSVDISGNVALSAVGGSIDIQSPTLNVSGSETVIATGGSISIGSGSLTVLGEQTLAASGGSITIDTGTLTVSGTATIDAHGDSAVTVTGSAITVAGNALTLSNDGGPVTLSGEDLRMRALVPNLHVSASTTVGEMVTEAARAAYVAASNTVQASNGAIPDFAASRAAVLDGPIGLLPPLPVAVQGSGILVPPEAATASPASQ